MPSILIREVKEPLFTSRITGTKIRAVHVTGILAAYIGKNGMFQAWESGMTVFLRTL
jgi:hypothetical protein